MRTLQAVPYWPTIPEPLLGRALTPPRPEDDPRVRWLAWRDAGPFRVWHKAYRSDFSQSRHAHANGSVDFNIAGSGSGTYLGRARDSRPGGVEFYRTDGDHTFSTGPRGIRVLHLLFTDDAVTPHTRTGQDHAHEPFEPDEGAAAGLGARLLRELHAGAGDASTGLALESLGHELLAAMRRWPSAPDLGTRAVARAVEYLRAAPADPVCLGDLAGELCVHPSHLARAFRRAMGVTPGEYHRRVRIARAAERLATSDKPIAGVAGDLGFADQAHLTRWFTRVTGLSPGAFRRTLRG